MKYVVAVHAGAGYHSTQKTPLYTRLCRLACLSASHAIESGTSAVEAVVSATRILENSPITNAGVGSNLTMAGSVECDASVMDGKSLLFGGVGAVGGAVNPVDIAWKLLEQQKLGAMSLGRVPPSVLVGRGARDWAIQQGCVVNETQCMVTEEAVRMYEEKKGKLDGIEHEASMCGKRAMNSSTSYVIKQNDREMVARNKRQKSACHETAECHECNSDGGYHEGMCTMHRSQLQSTRVANDNMASSGHAYTNTLNDYVSSTNRPGNTDLHDCIIDTTDHLSSGGIQDTVGAVVMDRHGNVASAVSSGGILLKQCGRIGPAATYGAGCWADSSDADLPTVAVVTSGCGEHLMRTLLARQCSDNLRSSSDLTSALNKTFRNNFFNSPFLHDVKRKLGGCLVLRYERGDVLEVGWGYSTESMCVGYVVDGAGRSEARVSRLDPNKVPGQTVCIEGKVFNVSC